jgi:serine/threonine protein kinase
MIASDESRGSGGRVIAGKYRLVELIGSGSMGVVWRAEHVTLGASVALKLLHMKHIGRTNAGDLSRRFLREARAAAAVRGPHVAQILDHGMDDGAPYIALELLDGESLDTRLAREKRLCLDETKTYIGHIARALARAREAGYIHRDLKPSNVFLVPSGGQTLAKVLDFGLAKAVVGEALSEDSMLTEVGQVLGTPTYMSPEQIRGRALDHRTDLWSLAVIAYECVCGALPFDGDTVQDLMLMICNEAPRLPSSFDPVLAPDFDAWFARAVAKDPDDRFQTAEELAAALARVESAEESELPIVSIPSPSRTGIPGMDSTLMAKLTPIEEAETIVGPPVEPANAPRLSRPDVPRLYDSVIDLEEITHFWAGASRTAAQDAEKLSLKLSDRVVVDVNGAAIGPLLMLEVVQAVRDGHLRTDTRARALGGETWLALDTIRVISDDGKAIDLSELPALVKTVSVAPPPVAAPNAAAIAAASWNTNETHTRWILFLALVLALSVIVIVLLLSR